MPTKRPYRWHHTATNPTISFEPYCYLNRQALHHTATRTNKLRTNSPTEPEPVASTVLPPESDKILYQYTYGTYAGTVLLPINTYLQLRIPYRTDKNLLRRYLTTTTNTALYRTVPYYTVPPPQFFFSHPPVPYVPYFSTRGGEGEGY
jgi:hypothetical protein